MNEGMLRDELARGQQAASLLQNDLLIECFTEIEKQYMASWRATDPSVSYTHLTLPTNACV